MSRSQSWEALRREIDIGILKITEETLRESVIDLLRLNLIRGRTVFSRKILHEQLQHPDLTKLYACAIAIIDSKLPCVGEVLLQLIANALIDAVYPQKNRIIAVRQLSDHDTVERTLMLLHRLALHGVTTHALLLDVAQTLLEEGGSWIGVLCDFLATAAPYLASVALEDEEEGESLSLFDALVEAVQEVGAGDDGVLQSKVDMVSSLHPKPSSSLEAKYDIIARSVDPHGVSLPDPQSRYQMPAHLKNDYPNLKMHQDIYSDWADRALPAVPEAEGTIVEDAEQVREDAARARAEEARLAVVKQTWIALKSSIANEGAHHLTKILEQSVRGGMDRRSVIKTMLDTIVLGIRQERRAERHLGQTYLEWSRASLLTRQILKEYYDSFIHQLITMTEDDPEPFQEGQASRVARFYVQMTEEPPALPLASVLAPLDHTVDDFLEDGPRRFYRTFLGQLWGALAAGYGRELDELLTVLWEEGKIMKLLPWPIDTDDAPFVQLVMVLIEAEVKEVYPDVFATLEAGLFAKMKQSIDSLKPAPESDDGYTYDETYDSGDESPSPMAKRAPVGGGAFPTGYVHPSRL
ncbi:pre-mRNA-splicing factor CWC22 [Carpediemonas membranifera]|uniref:Pre-mRNA-splicing factor CWC22 n=1 Tax=Carpediemonas membranifera TaxID=201153 RepID=A0A8J6BA07_9EUKA|nr:pre-mRNA-splicing factor CWC22 [Carpediemonas membranifera]|eukprot:KAG9396359.1 pre-mRNA-splicing factor CWC22 [Carpediemonas membranifera]